MMRRQAITLLAILAALGLSACAGLGGTFSIDRFLNKEITGDTLGACMARSYQAWARNKAWVQKNYAGAVALAERADAASTGAGFRANSCGGGQGLADRAGRFHEIAMNDANLACACGNALVEIERWSCAGPTDDKDALQRRFDAAAAVCEGR